MPQQRLQQSVRVTAVGFVVNLCLATIKLTAGILGRSSALVADAIESYADMIGSIIVWRGMVVAHKPADANHPYGHGKAETVAAGGVAVLLLIAAVVIAARSAGEILEPRGLPEPFTLIVLLGVVAVKETLFRVVTRVGSAVDSPAVSADAWHHRSDAITSAAAALGIGLALVGGERYAAADAWAAMFAAVIIAWNAVRLLRPVIAQLMDAEPDGDLRQQAATIAREVRGVERVEKCLARQMGYRFVLDMHVEVEATMTVAAAHAVAHDVEDAIRAQLPRVQEVTIHIEPFAPARP